MSNVKTYNVLGTLVNDGLLVYPQRRQLQNRVFCYMILLDMIQHCSSYGPKTVHLVTQFSF